MIDQISQIPDYIDGAILGQENLKKKLNFHIHNQHKNGFLPFTLFTAARGTGKTLAGRVLARNLKNLDGTKRPAFELNGVDLSSLTRFVDDVMTPLIGNGQEVALFIDEVAEVSDRVVAFLLSILQPDITNKSSITHQGITYDFDFTKINVVCATTNGEKLREAFKSRFKRIEIEPYSLDTLCKILHKNSDCIVYHEKTDFDIVNVCRQSPREVVLLSKDIIQYCKHCDKTDFEKSDWNAFRSYFDVKPLGLTVNEIEVLKYLMTGPKSLTSIAGRLNLDVSTVRQDIELYLLNKSLLIIDGKRKITKKGMELLRSIGY